MANRYWVGGTAQWDASALRWSATSGGPGGAGEPTSADDVFFDANSGTGTCTISGNRSAKSVNFTGYTGTFTTFVSAILNVFGDVTFSSGMTVSLLLGTDIRFKASATLISAGKTLANVMVEGAGITLTLGDSLTVGAASEFNLKEGTLNLNNYNLSTGLFQSSNTNTRSIAFGSGNIALISTTASTAVLIMGNAAGFSWTGTGGFTRNQAATATVQFGSTGGGTASNAPNLTVNAGSSTLTITGGSYFKNVNFTGSSCTVNGSYAACGNLTLATGGTYTGLSPTFEASGTVTSAGKTLGNTNVSGTGITVTLADAMTLATTGSVFGLFAGTLNLNNFNLRTAIFNSNNSNTRSIAFGSGNIDLTDTTSSSVILSMATATNFTWTGTGGFTRNAVSAATITFGSTAGGSASNAPNFSSSAGAFLTTITTNSYFKNVILSGSGSVSGLYFACGNLTLSSLPSNYLNLSPTFISSASITSSGKSIGNTIVNGAGITVTLADALTLGAGNTFTLTLGTFDAANFNVTTGLFSSSNTNTRVLNMGSGTWTISGSGATAWDTATATNLTVTPSTSTITMTSASAKTFAGGGKTYYNLNQGGAGALTISGSNTFNNITNSTQPATVTFTAGTTQTVSNFGLSGTAGNLVTINSTTPGSQATLSKASGQVLANFLSLQDNNATGGAEWYLKNGVRNSNVSGWFVNQAMMAWFF